MRPRERARIFSKPLGAGVSAGVTAVATSEAQAEISNLVNDELSGITPIPISSVISVIQGFKAGACAQAKIGAVFNVAFGFLSAVTGVPVFMFSATLGQMFECAPGRASLSTSITQLLAAYSGGVVDTWLGIDDSFSDSQKLARRQVVSDTWVSLMILGIPPLAAITVASQIAIFGHDQDFNAFVNQYMNCLSQLAGDIADSDVQKCLGDSLPDITNLLMAYTQAQSPLDTYQNQMLQIHIQMGWQNPYSAAIFLAMGVPLDSQGNLKITSSPENIGLPLSASGEVLEPSDPAIMNPLQLLLWQALKGFIFESLGEPNPVKPSIPAQGLNPWPWVIAGLGAAFYALKPGKKVSHGV